MGTEDNVHDPHRGVRKSSQNSTPVSLMIHRDNMGVKSQIFKTSALEEIHSADDKAALSIIFQIFLSPSKVLISFGECVCFLYLIT